MAFVAVVAVPAVAAFKLATCVVLATVNGAVPVATVDVITPDAETVVNAPVVAVVAPTVPLMFIEAVPVNPVAAPANDVAVNTPVLGTKLSLVDDVVAPTFPVVADEMTG